MRVGWWAKSHQPTLTLSHKDDGCAAVCSSPLPTGEGRHFQSAGYSNGSLGVGWVGSGMRGRGSSRSAAFSRKLARMTAA